ncbi:MAG: Stress responsive alpha-beta barrel domain protein [Candidatus Saccharibacteria bacterium]|nr:Stress responsive alpha-beta barrel domain protein [Candidatus Saccharibacteria bacterium]
MNIHIALYRWKPSATIEQINKALSDIEALAEKVPGIVEISTGVNTSNYSEGYTHVILVRGDSQAALEAYRAHPDHVIAAKLIDDIEDRGIGVDLETI